MIIEINDHNEEEPLEFTVFPGWTADRVILNSLSVITTHLRRVIVESDPENLTDFFDLVKEKIERLEALIGDDNLEDTNL